jgi:hypothetical protein
LGLIGASGVKCLKLFYTILVEKEGKGELLPTPLGRRLAGRDPLV